jgi:medium-chain acyl-[acyl-carrier-protein] hydrolase
VSPVSCFVHSGVSGATGGAWLYRPAPRRFPSVRLFCFPYAGVGASVFRQWPAGLPVEFDVCAVQLPGRTVRLSEPAVANIPVLVDGIVGAITAYLDIPFVFFGHSMGAILAAEVARELASRGLRLPSHLFVSGRRPPHMPDPESSLRGLSDPEFVAEINRRYGGIPPEILEHQDVLAMLLPSLRADIAALETHRPARRGPLQCPISAFGGSDDALTPPAHLEAWRGETATTFEVCLFPGGHFYLEPERAAVLAKVSAILAPILNAARSWELAT